MPWLTTEGASHQVADGETIVGSGPNAGWRLASRDLAPKHFVLRRQPSGVTVRACGVDAVIVINGTQSGDHPVPLHDGDTIDAGSARFLFSAERAGVMPTVAVAPAHLVETAGEVTYPIAGQAIGIGRDRLNTVVVRDPTASRFHAEIRREAGGFVLHPHGSSGTLVNKRRVGNPVRLQAGDRIEIGNVELRFMIGAPPPGAKTAEPVADDESSHRRTVHDQPAMEIPPERESRATAWFWLGAALILAASAFLALR
jgi:predicted component of type VI protein secretion system